MELEPVRIIEKKISKAELREFLDNPFPDMVKFVADVRNRKIALGGELHADAEEMLLENESLQENLWGGNIYPDGPPGKKVEFTALINIRPSHHNRSMEIEDPGLREQLRTLIDELFEL